MRKTEKKGPQEQTKYSWESKKECKKSVRYKNRDLGTLVENEIKDLRIKIVIMTFYIHDLEQI